MKTIAERKEELIDEAIRKLESYHCIPEDNVDAKHERFGEYIRVCSKIGKLEVQRQRCDSIPFDGERLKR